MTRTTGLPEPDYSNNGRPSDYRPEYDEMVHNFALLGACDREMCKIIGVSEVTFNAWKKEYPSFLKSLQEGREIADGKVARSLYQRAVGYSHPDVHITTQKIKLEDGSEDVNVIKTPIIKHYPPDPGAAKHFLNIRRRNVDKDSFAWVETSSKELSAPGGKPLIPNTPKVSLVIDPSQVPKEELEAYITILANVDPLDDLEDTE